MAGRIVAGLAMGAAASTAVAGVAHASVDELSQALRDRIHAVIAVSGFGSDGSDGGGTATPPADVPRGPKLKMKPVAHVSAEEQQARQAIKEANTRVREARMRQLAAAAQQRAAQAEERARLAEERAAKAKAHAEQVRADTAAAGQN